MSLILTINNSYSNIAGLTAEQFKRVKKLLSYTVDTGYYAGRAFPRTKYLIDSKGNFPSGLIRRVINHLQDNKLPYSINVPPARPRLPVDHKTDFGNIKPYSQQLAAISKISTTHHRGIISMPTGSGKSLVMALIVARLNVRTLIVVPNLELKKQLIGSFKAIFEDMSNITIENIDSSALKSAKDYDCLIIDEAHHAAAKTYQNLNKRAWGGIFYRFFLSATPFRNSADENLLFEGIAGEVIYQLRHAEAVKEKLIVPIEAYYIEIPKQNTSAKTWQQVYSQLIVNNTIRNAIIADLMTNLHTAGAKTLTLVKEIAHGNRLSVLTEAAFANGQDEDTRGLIEAFNGAKISTLIGTTGIIGEGVDTKPCEYVIIAGLGKAKSAFMQQVGRAVRTYPGKQSAKVIIFLDKSHKFTVRHFNAQKKILAEEYGIIPIKLDLE